MVGTGTGLYNLIKNNNTSVYKPLSKKSLCAFLKDVQENNKRDNGYSLLVGEYGAAVLDGDMQKVKELSHKYLLEKIIRYNNLSRVMEIDYDIVYILCSLFKDKDVYSMPFSWTIEETYLGDYEYDESHKYTKLLFKDGKFKINKYYSDGYYNTMLESTEDISKEDLFSLILRYSKK